MESETENRPRISVAILALHEEQDLSSSIDCVDQLADEIIVGVVNFAENGGFQQITVIYDEDDSYADEISGRIINSVELIKLNN